MADNTLSFVTSVDLGGLQSGLDAANDSVASFAGTLEDAMAAASAAANNLAEAEKKLGTSAVQGSAQAASIIAEYRNEVQRTEAVVKQISQSTNEASTATNAYAQDVNTAASSVQRLAAAEAEETTTLRGSISARMAAAAELRVLEGNIQGSTRAAAAFLTMLPGFGPALQAAFSVFGAVALIEVLAQVGEAFVHAFDLGGERARALDLEINNVSLDIKRSTDALQVQIDKLEQEQAKLEKKPFNGAKLVLDEAAEAADHLAERLDHVVDEELKVLKSMSGSLPQRILGIQGGTHDEQVKLEEHNKYIQQAQNTQQQLNESMSYANVLQGHLNELKQTQAEADKNELDSGVASGINLQSHIKATELLLQYQKQEQANIQATIGLEKQQAATQLARDNHQTGPKGPSLDTSQLKVIEEQFAEIQEKTIQIRGTGLTAGEAAAYWAPFLDEFKVDAEKYRALIDEAAKYPAGSPIAKGLLLQSQQLEGANQAYKKILDEIGKETQAAHKLLFEETLKTNPAAAKSLATTGPERDQYLEALKKQLEEDEKGAEALRKGLEAVHKEGQQVQQEQAQIQNKSNLGNIESQRSQTASGFQQQESKVQAGAAIGLTDPLKDLELLRTLHQQALAEDETFLQQEIEEDQRAAAQETAAAQGNSAKIIEIQERLNQQIIALEKKLQEDKQKAQQQQNNDTVQILQQQVQRFKTAYAEITQDFNSAITKMITTTEGPAKAFAQMLNQMIGQTATFVLQYLEKKAEMWLMDELFGKTAQAKNTTTQTVALAAQTTAVANAQTAQTLAVTTAQTAQTAAITTGIAAQTSALTVGIAAQHSIQGTSNVATVLADAAVAAAGAMAYYSAVSPPAAPALAAAQYAETAAYAPLAAFELGGVVGGASGMPVPIMAHAGERVLSASQTQTFHSLVDSRQGGSGGNIHLNYNPQVSAYDKSGVEKMLMAHAPVIHDIVRKGMKSGALSK